MKSVDIKIEVNLCYSYSTKLFDHIVTSRVSIADGKARGHGMCMETVQLIRLSHGIA